ncbi:CUE domain containing protein [Histomonas meleagridis]|uniref:CUE domain containing protein n=1 Tax=Histomonas meleagridis TaxID=135588 RepID=UPI00355AAA0D|nr:CUE domain containing protein [Histomonas meleagridis]KAH0804352.1 CUE domain containing protein [Histomonas meleagridis]
MLAENNRNSSQRVEELLKLNPFSTYEECSDILSWMPFDEANETLHIIYSPENNTDIIINNENDNAQNQVKEIQKQFPDMSDELCYIYLEDFKFNVKETIQGIQAAKLMLNHYEELETIKQENEPSTKKQIEILKESFPNLSEDVLNNALEAAGNSVEEAIKFLDEMDLYETQSQESDSNQSQPKNSVAILKEAFPKIEEDVLRNALEAAGNSLEVAIQILSEMNPTIKQNRNQNRKRRKQKTLNSFPQLPLPQKSSKTAAQPPRNSKVKEIPNDLKPLVNPTLLRESNVKQLKDIFPNYSNDVLEESLDMAKGDVEQAINIIVQRNPTKLSVTTDPIVSQLQEIFPAMPTNIIRDALKGNDFDTAAEILLQHSFEQPPLEDEIFSIRPDLTITQAKEAISRANGNVDIARKLVTEAPRSKIVRRPHGPKRIITIDLHGYTIMKAHQKFNQTIENAIISGNVAQVNFITGKGIHSAGGMPVLRPYILDLCRMKGLKAFVSQGNTGVVVCKL